MTNNENQHPDDIQLNTLHQHFANKFQTPEFDLSEQGRKMKQENDSHYSEFVTTVNKDFIFTTAMVRKYAKRLNTSASCGFNKIDGYHITYGCEAGLDVYISYILTLTLRYAVVPDSFGCGLLIPILKKTGLDPSVASNYRPITISVVLSKLLELYINDTSSFEPDESMYGYVPQRGPDMAVALANDVCHYLLNNGSNVYLCSLDAQGAFDNISHCVLFNKSYGELDTACWATLYNWYQSLNVCIQWGDSSAEPIIVNRGTRQGGLSSPLLFNIIYKPMVNKINNSKCGININNTHFNSFVYADDVLTASTTPTGLQTLVNIASKEIVKLGLDFNASKTKCLTLGKCQFLEKPSWSLNGNQLSTVDSLTYLGVIISNDQARDHIISRKSACSRAFYGLLPAGMTSTHMDPTTKASLWNTVCQPTVMYGLSTLDLSSTQMKELDTHQSKLIKQSLQLSKLCRSSKLLNAMGVDKISTVLEKQTLTLFRSVMLDKSSGSSFYGRIISDPKCHTNSLYHRATSIMKEHKITFGQLMTGHVYKAKLRPKRHECGVTDSISTLLFNFSSFNRNVLNMLLFPF